MTAHLSAERLDEIVQTLNAIQAELEGHGLALSGYLVDIAALEIERDANRARMPGGGSGRGEDRPAGG